MTNQYQEQLHDFEVKLQQLISAYQSLKEQKEALELELKHKNESLIEAHGALLALRKENDHLSMAGQLSGSTDERVQAKKKIDSLVREIDQCLALLNL